MGAIKALLIHQAERLYGPTSPECDHALGWHDEPIARCCSPDGCECCDMDDPCGPSLCKLCITEDERLAGLPRCAYCGDAMYTIVRGHHHTESGVDVTLAPYAGMVL